MGMFGFVLARHLALKYPQRKILVYDRDKKIIESLIEKRKHPLHFKDYSIPENVIPTQDLEKVTELSEIIVIAVPTQRIRSFAKELTNYLKKNVVILNVAKGIEIGTGRRISEILKEEIQKPYHYAVLSGGTIAGEMLKGDPLAAEIACEEQKIAKKLQEIFSSQKFRVYRNDDVIGVEIAGALKNPLAIASGMADALGYASSTKGALLSRGSLEIKRLALKLGAKEKTFNFGGQAAMGDIMTSCFGNTRNKKFGELIVKEGSVEKALKLMKREGKLVEGYFTSKAIHYLAASLHVEMPVQEQIFQILYNGKKPESALKDLMKRSLKPI